jgi:tRNA threonylcarbamoyl adenosine modification protein YjeE
MESSKFKVQSADNEYILTNVDEMRSFAREFAKTLHAPVCVALHGDLGMGKSEIARTIIQTLRGENTVVPSPTFTIVQSYDGISHFDLYRINDASELVEIGLPYAIANDITLIEWPDIAADMLPKNTIHIYITEHGNGRKVVVKKD